MFTTTTQRVPEKTLRSWYWFKVCKYIIMLVCTLLLPVNQMTYHMYDNFTPAYKTPTKTPVTLPEINAPAFHNKLRGNPMQRFLAPPAMTTRKLVRCNTVATRTTSSKLKAIERYQPFDYLATPHGINISKTTINGMTVPGTTVSGITIDTTTISTTTDDGTHISEKTLKETTTNTPTTFYWSTTKANEGNVNTLLTTFVGILDRKGSLHPENPLFRVKRLPEYTEENDDKNSWTMLSDLLVLYPCCITVLTILGMEMCGQFMKDPIGRCTSIFLIIFCIILTFVIFIVSLLASVRSGQVVMIFVSVLSAIFFILEFVDLAITTRTKEGRGNPNRSSTEPSSNATKA